jgi:hypothetical protein
MLENKNYEKDLDLISKEFQDSNKAKDAAPKPLSVAVQKQESI